MLLIIESNSTCQSQQHSRECSLLTASKAVKQHSRVLLYLLFSCCHSCECCSRARLSLSRVLLMRWTWHAAHEMNMSIPWVKHWINEMLMKLMWCSSHWSSAWPKESVLMRRSHEHHVMFISWAHHMILMRTVCHEHITWSRDVLMRWTSHELHIKPLWM